MKQLLLIPLLLTMPACARNNIKDIPQVYVKEACSYSVTISNVGRFFKDPFVTKRIFFDACISANFSHKSIFLDDYNENVTTMQLHTYNGYAKFYMNDITQTVILEFYCADDSYDYDHFLSSFFYNLNVLMQEEDDEFEAMINEELL